MQEELAEQGIFIIRKMLLTKAMNKA